MAFVNNGDVTVDEATVALLVAATCLVISILTCRLYPLPNLYGV